MKIKRDLDVTVWSVSVRSSSKPFSELVLRFTLILLFWFPFSISWHHVFLICLLGYFLTFVGCTQLGWEDKIGSTRNWTLAAKRKKTTLTQNQALFLHSRGRTLPPAFFRLSFSSSSSERSRSRAHSCTCWPCLYFPRISRRSCSVLSTLPHLFPSSGLLLHITVNL